MNNVKIIRDGSSISQAVSLGDVPIGTVFDCSNLDAGPLLVAWGAGPFGKEVISLTDPSCTWDDPVEFENYQELEGELTIRPKRR